MIEKIREKIPEKVRKKLKLLTAKIPILTFVFALPVGIFLFPISRKECILIPLNKHFHKLYAISDIYAIDCFTDIFVKEIYEKYRKIKLGDIVFDVGSNVGMFSIKAGRSVGTTGTVIAIEPAQNNIYVLQKNIQFYNLDNNVKIIPKAVGSSKGKSKLGLSKLSATHRLAFYSIPEYPFHDITVDIETLDNIISDLKIQRIDFMKIDAEGAELDIFKGG